MLAVIKRSNQTPSHLILLELYGHTYRLQVCEAAQRVTTLPNDNDLMELAKAGQDKGGTEADSLQTIDRDTEA